jgi:N-formylglutamate amidohydrolase
MTRLAYTLIRPTRPTSSVIFSSPHSGRDYSASFRLSSVLDAAALRSSEDAFVDELFSCAPDLGAPLIVAVAPRAYLDLNRAPDELDPALIEGVARVPHNPRVSSGLGVVPRVVANGRAIYRGKMPMAEAELRIARYWQPYHAMLKSLIEQSRLDFGEAVLIDCHSMPHEAIEAHVRPGMARPDVVLGDRFGAAAGRDVVDRIEAAFTGAGLRVARNSPFAGAYITQAYGRPSAGQHAVQVEIDRALYMDEARIARRADFSGFRDLMTGVVAGIIGSAVGRFPMATKRSAQSAALDDRIGPELGANRVCRPFCGTAFAGVGIEKIARQIGLIARREVRYTDADQAKGAGRARGIKQRLCLTINTVGKLRRLVQRMTAADQGEIGSFEFQGDGASRQILGLCPVGDLFSQPPKVPVQQISVGSVVIERGFLGNGLQFFVPLHWAGVNAARQMPKPVAHRPKARAQIASVPPKQIADRANARLFKRTLGRCTDAPDDFHRLILQEGLRLCLPDHRKTTRFVDIRRDFREIFVVRQAHRSAEPQFSFHAPNQTGQQHGGWRAMQAGGSCQVQKRLVQRQGLNRGGQHFHHCTDGTARLDIGGETGFHDNRFGAKLQRLKHRHGRPDAGNPRDIAACGHNAPYPAANNDGFVAQIGIVALFDRCIKSVTVHMGDGKSEQVRM